VKRGWRVGVARIGFGHGQRPIVIELFHDELAMAPTVPRLSTRRPWAAGGADGGEFRDDHAAPPRAPRSITASAAAAA
jgi:hypothetical protein